MILLCMYVGNSYEHYDLPYMIITGNPISIYLPVCCLNLDKDMLCLLWASASQELHIFQGCEAQIWRTDCDCAQVDLLLSIQTSQLPQIALQALHTVHCRVCEHNHGLTSNNGDRKHKRICNGTRCWLE